MSCLNREVFVRGTHLKLDLEGSHSCFFQNYDIDTAACVARMSWFQ